MHADELISHGNTQIYEVLKDSDFDLGLLASGGKKKGVDGVLHKGSEVLENLKAGGAEVIVGIAPPPLLCMGNRVKFKSIEFIYWG